MSEPKENLKQESVYTVKGVPVKVFLTETGDFRWVPAFSACGDVERAKVFLDVLQKMPPDRRAVWATRLDTEQALNTCPVVRDDVDLHKAFDQLCAAYNKSKLKAAEETAGGEKPNE